VPHQPGIDHACTPTEFDLLEKADKCRRLAGSIADPLAKEALELLASRSEEEAAAFRRRG
jgi:hypothetical protein